MRNIKIKNFAQNTVVLMCVIFFAKILGMLRDVVLANYFGTSNVSDAYLISVSIPSFLFFFVGHSLSTAFLPMYNKIRHEEGEEKAQLYMNALICGACVISTIAVVFLLCSPQTIVKIFAAGFDEETTQIASTFIRICSFSLYFMTIINVWGAYLQAKNNFLIPASVSVPRNVVIMVSIVLAAKIHVSILGIGLLLAYASEFLLLLPFVLAKGYKPQLKLDYKSSEMKATYQLVVPILIGVAVSQINHIIDRSLASTVITGGLSALTYASILNNAVQEVLVTGIITILFAKCSSWVASGEHEKVRFKLNQTINTMAFLLLPATVGIFVCSSSIVECVLCRGEFDEHSLQMTTGALCCYTIGLFFLAIRDTLVKVFYAYKKTKTTTITSIVAISINIVLNFILVRYMGLNGLALATALSAIFHSITLYILLRKHIGDFGFKTTAKTILKTVVACSVMAISLIVLKQHIHVLNSELLELLICVAVGAIIYLMCSFILRTKPLMDAFKGITKRHSKPNV